MVEKTVSDHNSIKWLIKLQIQNHCSSYASQNENKSERVEITDYFQSEASENANQVGDAKGAVLRVGSNCPPIKQ